MNNMANNELNTNGIIDSIDNFNKNSQQICETLNGLEGSINEFNKSITRLESLKNIQLTKKKLDELSTYKQSVNHMIKELQGLEGDLSKMDELIETVSKFGEEIHSVMKNSNVISFNTISNNVRELDKKITSFNKRIDTFIERELLKKMDEQYENIMKRVNTALEKQKKMIDLIDEKVEQIGVLQPTKVQPANVQFSSENLQMMQQSSNAIMESLLGGTMEDAMDVFIGNIIERYKDNETSKASIYSGLTTKALKVLSEEGELEASYILGEKYYEEGRIDEAVVEYERLVDKEDDRCLDKLIKIYKEKAEEGNPLYQEKLGFELYRGKIIQKDIDKAIDLLQKAQENGSTNSKKYLELINLK